MKAKTLKIIIGIIATMAGTQALMFWLGAIDRPIWILACLALYTAGIWCFADHKKEEAR